MKVRYRPRAKADIDEIFQYLNERSPSGALHVLSAIADAIDEIGANPDAWQATSLPDIRAKTVGRYRYKIFYAAVGDETVEIIHVRHTARRPWT
ncbi:type II toxin-antitoxin system RelE/ParE family toxin [Undibacter mobilis]|uniref:type II toxin-antitoxin system RelE/ParE family toxin n=1 Tax=Undibacter mobilis TaxID=2292256 RepID=UPI00143D6B33|nr:type II toxin-antitoxin system RelE/ParE family toxin [Undibacter mobilis]